MNVMAHLELMTLRDCQLVCNHDAVSQHEDPSKFVKGNLATYYVACNTWLMVVKQASEYGFIALYRAINKNGLKETIRELDVAAASYIRGEEVQSGLARSLINDIKNTLAMPARVSIDSTRGFLTDLDATVLQCLRYAKRFSPPICSVLKHDAIESFIATQKLLKENQRQPLSRFVLSDVRQEMFQLVDWHSLTMALKKISLDDIIFTSGVSLECGSDLASKLRSVLERNPEYFVSPFGIPLVSLPARRSYTPNELIEPQYWGKNCKDEVRLIRIAGVPKNYKTARVIGPELTVRQGLARRAFVIMDRYTPDCVPLHNQEINQELARQGSIDQSVATIDLSRASDMIHWVLLGHIAPQEFLDVIRKLLPTHYVLSFKDENRRMLQSACTMGNSITFWLESVVFASIALAAVHRYERMAGVKFADSQTSVYGDDIIVPDAAAETVMEYLSSLGFVVNDDKSFHGPTPYRESCGEEYVRGTRVSSVYYPRFPIEGELSKDNTVRVSQKGRFDEFTSESQTSLGMLIALQHKLYLVSRQASMFLENVVLNTYPKMTRSTPDQGLADLWSFESQPIKGITRCSADARKGVDPLYTTRLKHLAPVWKGKEGSARTDNTSPSEEPVGDSGAALIWRLWMLYKYQHFLRYGPQYEDDLCRLLGVTKPPISFIDFTKSGEVSWTPVAEP